MRKLLWLCAAAAVLAAVAVYLAADHAGRHPRTLLGRCLVGAYHAGTQYNVFYSAGKAAAEHTTQVLHHVLARRIVIPVLGQTNPVAAAPAPHAEHAPAPCPQSCPAATEHPVVPAPRMLGHIDIPVVEETSEPIEHEPLQVIYMPDEEPPMAEAPATMPHAEEPSATPMTMPHADEEEATGAGTSPFDFWMDLFRDAAQHVTPAGAEESDKGVVAPDPADCKEDPYHPYQYPGCPYGGCPDSHRSYDPHAGCCPYSGKCPRCESARPHCECEEESELIELQTAPVEPKADEKMTGQLRDLREKYEKLLARRGQREAFEVQVRARFQDFLSGRNTLDAFLEEQRFWVAAAANEYAAIEEYNRAMSGFVQPTNRMPHHKTGPDTTEFRPGDAPLPYGLIPY